jgi:hypothetical protein
VNYTIPVPGPSRQPMTTATDLAPSGRQDLDEARSRLERLAAVRRIHLESVGLTDLDRADGDAYTIREMASRAAASVAYADAVVDLSASRSG